MRSHITHIAALLAGIVLAGTWVFFFGDENSDVTVKRVVVQPRVVVNPQVAMPMTDAAATTSTWPTIQSKAVPSGVGSVVGPTGVAYYRWTPQPQGSQYASIGVTSDLSGPIYNCVAGSITTALASAPNGTTVSGFICTPT